MCVGVSVCLVEGEPICFAGSGSRRFLIRRYREGDSKDWDRNLNFFV